MKEALKMGLEALKNEKALNDAVGVVVDATDEAIKALEEALANREQGEPVAWIDVDERIKHFTEQIRARGEA